MKACMYCAEEIKDSARLCRHCGKTQKESESAEGLLFEGAPRHAAFAGEYIVYGMLSLLLVGLPMLIYRYLTTITEKWTITTKRVQVQRGILSKRIDTLDLWRVKDVAFEQTLFERLFNVSRIVVASMDSSDPTLQLRGLPNERALFDRLLKAVESQRRGRVLAVES